MRKYLLILSLSMLMVLAVGVGIAAALPATMTDSANTAVSTTTPTGARVNTEVGANIAEHSSTTPIANASYGPHGKFTTDTNACGRCHQLHQAKAERLFRFDTSTNTSGNNAIYQICTYCHNFNGQSTYDVKDGMIWDTADGSRYATNGGGFERMLVVEGPNAAATLVKANSSHQVNFAKNASGEYIRFNAPGGNSADHIALKCSSCHNPHGSSNARQLVEAVVVTDGTGAARTNLTAVSNLPEFVKNRFGDELSVYPAQISDFCGACHQDYLNKTKSGSETSGINVTTMYRHKMNMAADNTFNYLPTETKTDATDVNIGAQAFGGRSNDGSFGFKAGRLQLPLGTSQADPLTATTINKVVCTTCHFAHGTSAEMTKAVINNSTSTDQIVSTNKATPYNLLTASGAIRYETIKNLRMDNRAVCQNCHNRNSVDATAPTLVEPLDPTALNDTISYSGAATITAGQKVKRYGSVIVLRFNQYMAKAQAETATNYTFDGALGNPTSAKLQPDGRTVVLSGGNTATAASVTLTTAGATGIQNINGVAANVVGAQTVN